MAHLLPTSMACDKEKSPRLVDRVRDAMRLKHYSLRTERTYWAWMEQKREVAATQLINHI